jgi:hypothetical protein
MSASGQIELEHGPTASPSLPPETTLEETILDQIKTAIESVKLSEGRIVRWDDELLTLQTNLPNERTALIEKKIKLSALLVTAKAELKATKDKWPKGTFGTAWDDYLKEASLGDRYAEELLKIASEEAQQRKRNWEKKAASRARQAEAKAQRDAAKAEAEATTPPNDDPLDERGEGGEPSGKSEAQKEPTVDRSPAHSPPTKTVIDAYSKAKTVIKNAGSELKTLIPNLNAAELKTVQEEFNALAHDISYMLEEREAA